MRTDSLSRMLITRRELPELARGCSLLGSGGGGDVHVPGMLLERALGSGRVHVLEPSSLDAGLPVAMVGVIGSPTVLRERPPGAGQLAAAVRALGHHRGEQFAALAPFEIGGLNGLMAVAAAAETGLALLDCDAMGRAFPRLDSTVLAGRISAVPTALASPDGMTLVIDRCDVGTAEDVIRRVLPAFGAWAAMATHPTTAGELADAAVIGSVTRAMRLGVSLPAMDFYSPTPAGVVIAVRRGQDGGYAVIEVDDGRTLRVDFVDEYVCATIDGEAIAHAPEIICLVDLRSAQPVLVDALAEGHRVRLLRIAAPAEVARRSDELGLAVYGMERIG